MRTAIVLALTFGWTTFAEAQPSSSRNDGELFVSLSGSHIFRAEDRSFGDRPAIGGGVRLPWTQRIGVELEINRALGLEAEPARCGLALGCEGAAREGLLDATLATANVYVRFPRGRVEPYIVGGVGGLWATSVSSVTTVRNGIGVMSELEERDAGLAIGAGAGVDIKLTGRFSLRPEIRIYDSTAMSRANLAVIRTSVAAGWRW